MQHYFGCNDPAQEREDTRVSYFRHKNYSPAAQPTPTKHPKPKCDKISGYLHRPEMTLKQKIEQRLMNTPTIDSSHRSPLKPKHQNMGHTHKMLFERETHSPLPHRPTQTTKSRTENRREFELRQEQTLLKRKHTQQLLQQQRERTQLSACTFKPRLTVYRAS